jgi:cation diffusion facilitator CzcD-associated flavoprotein CzcO
MSMESARPATRERTPYAENPMQPRHVETLIIGSGISGLLAAIRLQNKQSNDFILLERSAERAVP